MYQTHGILCQQDELLLYSCIMHGDSV